MGVLGEGAFKSPYNSVSLLLLSRSPWICMRFRWCKSKETKELERLLMEVIACDMHHCCQNHTLWQPLFPYSLPSPDSFPPHLICLLHNLTCLDIFTDAGSPGPTDEVLPASASLESYYMHCQCALYSCLTIAAISQTHILLNPKGLGTYCIKSILCVANL